ncbi:MAG TPA: anti-sigma factor [Dehalococcoidia bacterium]|nr:anti-sigma factor [Dehalococcoidia bacterium]
MNCEEAREELEAYSLGALEANEARRVAAHIRGCDECAQIARAYEMAVEHIALAVPLFRPSRRLKERILGGIGAFRPPVYAGLMRRRIWAATAAAVLVGFGVAALTWAIILSSQVHNLRENNTNLASELSQIDEAQRQAMLRSVGDLSTTQYAQQRSIEDLNALLRISLDPELIPTALYGTQLASAARCNYVWSSQQSLGALTCKDIPSTASSLTYALWATKGDQTIALGDFVPRLDGTAQILVKFPSDVPGPVTNYWVTLEQLGSSRAKPSGQAVLQKAPEQQAAR